VTNLEGPAAAGSVGAIAPAEAPVGGSPVAAALAELDTLADRELAEHPEAYQRIHAELQAALATIDNA
jgi:hypothetical protein